MICGESRIFTEKHIFSLTEAVFVLTDDVNPTKERL